MKNEKGITLIILVMTVLILIVITSTIASNAYDSTQLQRLTKLNNDIKMLEDRIAAYYVENDDLPKDIKEYTKTELSRRIEDLSINDGEKYYKIDVTKLDNITLNYAEDEYIVNEESHAVYNLNGITYKGIIYHTTEKDEMLIQKYQ